MRADTFAGDTGPLWQISVAADSGVIADASSDGATRDWTVPVASASKD